MAPILTMTKREAAIVAAFTGKMLGDFETLHAYIEEKLKRPVFLHELALRNVAGEIRLKSKNDFINLEIL